MSGSTMSCRTALRSIFAFVAASLVSASAHALLFRAYLAPTGLDTNPCTLAQPCRLLPAALAAVTDGGEIWMLDSANYNAVTVDITKSVSILAVPGAVGSFVTLNGGPALSISAAGLKVGLRNVVIAPVAGAAAGTDGIVMAGASSLSVEDSLIANVPGHGVNVAGTGTVKVSNTVIRNVGASGVRITGGGRGVVSGSRIINAAIAIQVLSAVINISTAAVTDTVLSGGTTGVSTVASAPGSETLVTLTRCTVEGFGTGLFVGPNPGSNQISLYGSTVVNNGILLSNANSFAGSIESFGNNVIRGNGAPSGTLVVVAGQ